MFILQSDRLIWWPVTFQVPADGGYVDPVTVKFKFRANDLEHVVGLLDRADAIKNADSGAKMVEQMTDLVMELASDWEGIGAPDASDPNGPSKPLAFTKDNVRRLLNQQSIFLTIVTAYRDFSMGFGKEREKN